MPSYLDPTESQVAALEGRKLKQRQEQDRRSGKTKNPYQAMKAWCRGRSATFRTPFAIWFGFMLLAYLINTEWAASVDIVNRGIHNMGHGMWDTIGGGSGEAVGGIFFQIVIPALVFAVFGRFYDFYGMAATMAWGGTAFLWNVPYIQSAVTGDFPRSVNADREPLHDWVTMLGTGEGTEGIAEMTGVFYYFGLLALAFAVYLAWNQLYFMWKLEERRNMVERRLEKSAHRRD